MTQPQIIINYNIHTQSGKNILDYYYSFIALFMVSSSVLLYDTISNH